MRRMPLGMRFRRFWLAPRSRHSETTSERSQLPLLAAGRTREPPFVDICRSRPAPMDATEDLASFIALIAGLPWPGI